MSLITLVTPVLALLLGSLLNGEEVPLRVWLGTACIGAGLSIYQWESFAAIFRPGRARGA